MSEAGVMTGVQLLHTVVDRLLDESVAELPGPAALSRCAALLVARERLDAAALAAVRDVDSRQLYALDGAGSTRGWLRTQVSGDSGQLSQARRLGQRQQVFAAQAAGELSGRGAAQVCTALDKLPAQVDEPVLEAALVDGLRSLLGRQLGLGLAPGVQPTSAQLALRAELAEVVGGALAATASAPAERLTPTLLLLARQVAPGQLGWALGYLLDALVPEGIDEPDERDFYLDLVPVLDGEWDLRGHLDHETGALLAAELDRQARATEAAAKAAAAAGAGPPADTEPLAAFDAALDTEPDPHASTPRLLPPSRQRHDALAQLLRDAVSVQAGSGHSAPAAMTVVTTVEAVEGRVGALPGMMLTAGQPIRLRPATLQRLGCFSELSAVLLDAFGHPVGASSPRRSASRKERAALLALWGPWCAIDGCTSTDTVPHHVDPWWLSRRTRLRDLIPICKHCHHDVHEGGRTLRLQDGRLIDGLGWVTTAE